jgi:two-component system response regulator PilR (NtrC family)
MRSSQPSVLVVDAEADVRELIAARLVADGFDVAASADREDARARLTALAFDALVVDPCLPDAGGLDVLEFALTRQPGILAVVTAAAGSVLEAVAAIGGRPIDLLIKPLQVAQLARVLQAEFERRRLREENAELRAQLRSRIGFDPIAGQIPDEGINFTSVVSHLERELIVRCLEKTGGNKRQAARLLRLSRTTLIDKVHRLNRDQPSVGS